jgi:tRNA threonylcarbamoyl adenosine modification protein YeaZ
MSRVLAIDTSAGTSVAVVEQIDGVTTVLGEVNIDDPMKHAENIGLAIREALAAANPGAPTRHPARGIDAVVVGRGPAPFTGLRVGVAAAIMFAEGLHLPLFGVVSHDAIALAEFDAGLMLAAGEQLLVTTDARRSEVYWATYGSQNSNGMPQCSGGPAVLKPAALEEQLGVTGMHYVASSQKLTAANLAKAYFAQHASGESSTDITALYLRAPDAVPTAAKKVSG